MDDEVSKAFDALQATSVMLMHVESVKVFDAIDAYEQLVTLKIAYSANADEAWWYHMHAMQFARWLSNLSIYMGEEE